MAELFGTDGIRGVAGQYPLDQPTIERIGCSLAIELARRSGRVPQLVIGRDTRESGEWIEAAIARGARSARAGLRFAGVITTPGVAYLTRALDADAGVVISASHNSYEDNGIKVFSASGRKLDDEAELAIEQSLRAQTSMPARAPGLTDWPKQADRDACAPREFSDDKIETDASLREKYLAFLRGAVGAELNLRGLKIAIDCANGAAYELAPKLFSAIGADLVVINADPNGRNINLDCGSLHPEKLRRTVIEQKADLGLAFDGDADRLLMVDERGDLVDGDQVLFIMADYLASKGALSGDRVVATVMSNLGLELALADRGVKLARTAVGDKYVLDELLKAGGSLGGEQSGHIIFPEISLAGDGMITALEVLRVVAERNISLGALASAYTRYPQVTINVRVSSKPSFDAVPPIKEAIKEVEKEMAGRGRLIVRYSGTENLARVMVEGQDETTIRNHAESIAQVITAQIG
ncbi:MAG TPA: phosphoglucosamine mutase [Blastocatellia bacterium]|jgi:phosphoglucosamine mutase|nr:phosphoglucosamine mutase [Blastocatellia bacterium]